jgi:hypothetical protein
MHLKGTSIRLSSAYTPFQKKHIFSYKKTQ